MDADVWFVDELRDGDVAGHTDDLIGLVFCQALRRCEKIHHLLDRRFGGNGEVGVGTHRDVIRRGSARGHVSFIPLRTVSWRRPRNHVSIAV